MKVWLDDEREAPEGWEREYTPGGCVSMLRGGRVTHLSLDQDLGPWGTGYTVLCWLEREVACRRWRHSLPEITIHSANPVGRARMEAAIRSIQRWNEGEVRDGE